MSRYVITRFIVNEKHDALQFDLAEGEQVVKVRDLGRPRKGGQTYRVTTVRPIPDSISVVEKSEQDLP